MNIAKLAEGLSYGVEPVTSWTDAVLAVWTALLAYRLFRRGASRLWAWGFVAATATAIAGAVFHGFRIHFAPAGVAISWKLVPVTTGIAALLLGMAAANAWLEPRRRRVVHMLLWLELAVCVAAAMASNEFAVAAIDYLIVLLAILYGALQRLARPEARFLAAGVVASIIGAAVQMLGYNDVFHVIQMFAMYLLYRGGAELRAACDTRAVPWPSSSPLPKTR